MKNSRRSFIKKLGLSGAVIASGSSFLRGSLADKDSRQTLEHNDYHFPHGNNKIPICFLLDDSCPLIHVYWFHKKPVDGKGPFTGDGRLLVKNVPNSFMDKFC